MWEWSSQKYISTVYSTTTITIGIPGSAYYTAYVLNSIISTANGVRISNGYLRLGVGHQVVSAAKSPYDGCIACVTGTDCGLALFLSNKCLRAIFKDERIFSQSNEKSTSFTVPNNDPIAALNG